MNKYAYAIVFCSMALTPSEHEEEQAELRRLAAAQTAIAIGQLIIRRHNLSLDDNGVFHATPKGEFRRYPRAMRDLPKEEGSGVFLRFNLDDGITPEQAHRIMDDIEKCLQPQLSRAEKLSSVATFFPPKEKVNVEAQSRAMYVEITPFIDRAMHCQDIDQRVSRREALKLGLGALGGLLTGDGIRRVGDEESSPDERSAGAVETFAGLFLANAARDAITREAGNIIRVYEGAYADNSPERMALFYENIARQFRVGINELKRFSYVSTGRQLS